MLKTLRLAAAFTTAVVFLAGMTEAQTDPGVQSGNRGTGAALSSVLANDNAGILTFFNDGLSRFQEIETVSGGANNGLGPRFNSNSCSSCHAQPAIGGSGPASNPQAQFISSGVAPKDTMPYFVTSTGPTVEARFPFYFNKNGSANTSAPNGGVEDLFTVTGRSDAGACSLTQPSFSSAQAANNIIFRIPTPVFGAGLVENLDDSTLLSNMAKNINNRLGISGAFNHNGNDGTISRFGWKAQNKSLHIFTGEAYNVEMGITNLLFPQERPLPGEDGGGASGLTGLPSTCLNLSAGGYPEDINNPGQSDSSMLDDVSAFANFMRGLAPPPTGSVVLNGATVASSSISNGASLFSSIGCATCHNPSPGSTQQSKITGSLSSAAVSAYSDFEIHHMGSLLTDNVAQGGAGGDQFRTAPLWGLGQRIFLLHDGRTTSLVTAIQDHNSRGSEASTVEGNFANLKTSQQQDLLNFLRSL
jgi:CxxC motif-containing protein (DUF1111 family)